MQTEAKVITIVGVITLILFGGAIWWMSQFQNPDTTVYTKEQLLGTAYQTKGNPQAAVTLVEFADYQCPGCAGTHPFINSLLAQYGDKVQFVYRHFPLQQHQYAVLAAMAAEAAGQQQKYWEMHDLLFKNQNEWSSSTDAKTIFRRYAQELQLDITRFDQDIVSPNLQQKVQAGLSDGTRIGVMSTPTFYLNGKRYAGSLSDLPKAVEKLITAN